ncbi:MAG: peptidylprolyl isomerase [Burkholderiales bacterium]
MNVASINGVPLHASSEALTPEALRQRACTELLRQAAQRAGLLRREDAAPVDGIVSDAASAAIDALIDREVRVPPADDAACRRHFAANARSYAQGERARVRHVLFAVTPGVDVGALRRRAEATLIELRASGDVAQAARTLSNCPSGVQGGDLGWISEADCAPEFGKQVFEHAGLGVLPRLLQTRHGFHVVGIVEREAGSVPEYEAVRGAVARTLERQAFVTALRQYIRVLAGAARVEGVDLEGADTPLLQ